MMKFDARCGNWIPDIVAGAIAQAKRHNCQVLLKMNGSKLKVNKRLSVRHVLRQHHEMEDAQWRRYAKSDHYKNMMAEMEINRQFMQSEVDWCVQSENLPAKDNLLLWLKRYCPNCDHIGVNTRADLVVSFFQSLGYLENDCCGLATYSPDESDRYLVGQVISMLRFNGHIHQGLGYLVEREIMKRSASEELEVQPL